MKSRNANAGTSIVALGAGAAAFALASQIETELTRGVVAVLCTLVAGASWRLASTFDPWHSYWTAYSATFLRLVPLTSLFTLAIRPDASVATFLRGVLGWGWLFAAVFGQIAWHAHQHGERARESRRDEAPEV